ncbi:MAG: hypothetical protein HYX29_07175 [Solirubrobacterales bacterium]|nr:hypothetical protein [Solirubrobacterales bacterium]
MSPVEGENPGVVEIADEDALLHRIPNNPDMTTSTDNGKRRPSTASFKPTGEDQAISVHLRRLIPDPAEPLTVLDPELHEGCGLVEFAARIPRELGFGVDHTPTIADPSHGSVIPPDTYDAASKSVKKRI